MNVMEFNPSYNEYRKILNTIKASGKYCDYWEAKERDEFIVLRHDIEFSVDRAFKMSQIETEEEVCSTYFVQITNNAYNALSMKNLGLLRDMQERGHKIGLHYHLCGVTDPLKTRDGIRDQIRILSEMCKFPIDRFSIHRPRPEVYYNQIHIEGIINAYAPEFFTYVDAIDEDTQLEVKYIADSQHRWNYGFPDKKTIADNPKIQLLVHPYSWTEDGLPARENFESLLKEMRAENINDFDSECQYFGKIKSEFL